MKLKIKESSMGNQYVIAHPKLGALVMDTTLIKSNEFKHWYDLGFQDHFEVQPTKTLSQRIKEVQENPNPDSKFKKRLADKNKTK